MHREDFRGMKWGMSNISITLRRLDDLLCLGPHSQKSRRTLSSRQLLVDSRLAASGRSRSRSRTGVWTVEVQYVVVKPVIRSRLGNKGNKYVWTREA